jgi:hypothetical protein
MQHINLTKIKNTLSENKIWIMLFFAILILGAFLRLYKLGNQSFIADEYLGINASYGYHKTGQWKFWDFNREKITDSIYKRSRTYYWQVAQVFDLLEPSERNARLVSVAWGVVGIISIFIVAYLVTKNLIIALISAFLAAVSVSSLMYDRKLRMYSMFVPVYLWFSYALFYLIESKVKKGAGKVKIFSDKMGINFNFLIPVVLLGALSFDAHLLSVNIIPALLAYLLIQAYFSYRAGNSKNRYIIFFLLLILFSGSTLFNVQIQHAMSFFSFWINNWSYLEKVAFDYSYMPLAGVFFALGIYYLLRFRSKIGVWTVVSYLVPLFLAIMVWKRNAGHQYILFTQSFKIIIMAGGIYYLAKVVSENVFSSSKRWLFGLILLFLVLVLNFSFFFSKESFYENPRKWSYSNYREVFQYYLRHRGQNNALITRPSTNYYLSGTGTDIIGYDDGNELTKDRIVEAQKKYDELWLIFSKTTYIKSDARDYYKQGFEKLKTNYTNDQIDVWRWQKNTSDNEVTSKPDD